MMEAVGALEGYVPQLLAVLFVVAVLVRLFMLVVKSWPFITRFIRFLDAVMGHPAEDGKERRPSMVERLEVAEEKQESQGQLLAAVNYQLNPNGGGSALDKLTGQLTGLSTHLTGLSNEVTSISELMLGHFGESEGRDDNIATHRETLRSHAEQLGYLEHTVRTLTEQRTAYLTDRAAERAQLLEQVRELRGRIESLLDRPYDDGQPTDPTDHHTTE